MAKLSGIRPFLKTSSLALNPPKAKAFRRKITAAKVPPAQSLRRGKRPPIQATHLRDRFVQLRSDVKPMLTPADKETLSRLRKSMRRDSKIQTSNFKYLKHRIRVANNHKTLNLYQKRIDNPTLFGDRFTQPQTAELKDVITEQRRELNTAPPRAIRDPKPLKVGAYDRLTALNLSGQNLKKLGNTLTGAAAHQFYKDLQEESVASLEAGRPVFTQLSLSEKNAIRMKLYPKISRAVEAAKRQVPQLQAEILNAGTLDALNSVEARFRALESMMPYQQRVELNNLFRITKETLR